MFFFNKLKKNADDFQKLLSYYKAELELNELLLREYDAFHSNFNTVLNKYLGGEVYKDTLLYALKQLYDRQVSSVKRIIQRRYDLSLPYDSGSIYLDSDHNCEAFLELMEITYFDAVANINGKFDRLDKRITEQAFIKWKDSVVRRQSAEKELQNKLKIDDVAFVKIKNEAKAKATSSQAKTRNSTYAVTYVINPPRLCGVTVSATVFKDRWKPSCDWLKCGHYKYDRYDQCNIYGDIPSWVQQQIPLSIEHMYNKLPPKETQIINWGYGEGVHFVNQHDSSFAITLYLGNEYAQGRVFMRSTSKSAQTD